MIICSYNGAPGVRRCLAALQHQRGEHRLEVIVVDDGSSDDTAQVAEQFGAQLLRHPINRGLSAARNTGISHASAEIVAFLDDDCVVPPDWSVRLLAAYDRHQDPRGGDAGQPLGLGAAVFPAPMAGIMSGFLGRHNPLQPLELALEVDERLLYRLGRYLRSQWSHHDLDHPQPVFSLPGASMSFWRRDLVAIGMFDERIRFGGEDFDLCRRLAGRFPDRPLIFDPGVDVVHHFRPELSDTLRRSRSYARGAARLCRKWPTMRPTVFPLPLAAMALLAAGTRGPAAAFAAVALPYLGYGSWLSHLRSSRDPRCLLDPWIQLAQETYANIGFAEGAWQHRAFPREQHTVAIGRYAGSQPAPAVVHPSGSA